MSNFQCVLNIWFCLTELLVFYQKLKKKQKKMTSAFNFILNFWRTMDESGSMTWTISNNKISILYYFNDESIDLEESFNLLNSSGSSYELNQPGWKLPFIMQVSDPKTWNRDYFKSVEFVVRR